MDYYASKDKIEKIREEIRKHDRLYYVLAQPEISDFEYDQLMKRLESLEKSFPDLVTMDSPTQRTGSDLTKDFRKVQHRVPMLSIANTYSREELIDFDRRIRETLGGKPFSYTTELKIDGVAIALRYRSGNLAEAVTRGDGKTGDDVTANIRTVRSIPLKIASEKPLEIRGEIYLSKKFFAELNESLPADKKMRNPRNAAAGTLKLQNPGTVAERKLGFLAHFAIGESFAVSHRENMDRLQALGFPVVIHSENFSDIENVIRYCDEWEQKRHELDYETDGVVIKVDEIALHKKLGTTAKSPRWVTAYKYKPESVSTKLLAVEAQVGRTGVLTPVARLEPVSLSGTTVSNATLHNYDEIARQDIRIGDTVFVEKGGEIIPKVTGVDLKKRKDDVVPYIPPQNCPECGEPLIKTEGEVALRCDNLSCPAQRQRSIEHFVSRAAMNIEEIGPALVEQLLKENLIRDWTDLYRLDHGQISVLERMGDKSASNVRKAIEKSKEATLDRLIHALGIRHVGAGAARTLAGRIENLLDLEKLSVEELDKIPEIGPVMAESIHAWFTNPENMERLHRLAEAGVRFDNKAGLENLRTDSPVFGKTLVVTGTLEKFTREEIESEIRKFGGKASKSVSKKTDYLVAGREAGSKLEKARKLGVKILTEDEFLEMTDTRIS